MCPEHLHYHQSVSWASQNIKQALNRTIFPGGQSYAEGRGRTSAALRGENINKGDLETTLSREKDYQIDI